jgi:hypothetical protein
MQHVFCLHDDPVFNNQVYLVFAEQIAAIPKRNSPLAFEPQAVMRQLET